MQVRDGRPEDAEAIANIHVASWQAAYRGVVDDITLDSLDPGSRVASIRTWIPSGGWYVLEDAGAVIGFAHAARSRDDDAEPDVAEVTTIYLEPSAWRRGGGRRLLEGVLSRLQGQRFAAAALWVLEANERGRRFYEALGWSLDGAVKSVDVGTQTLTEVRYRVALDSRP